MSAPEAVPLIEGTRYTRRELLRAGGGLLIGGVVVIVVAVALSLPGALTAIVAIAGVILAYLGISRLVSALARRRVDLMLWVCGAWLVALILGAIFAPILPLGQATDVSKTLLTTPFEAPFQDSSHILGTNAYGLDMLARVVDGARSSLSIALLAVAISTLIGGTLGVLAGFFRRGIDSVVSILANALLAVPPLILLIVMATVLSPNVRNVAFALSLLTIPVMVRLARAQTVAYSQRGFVLAARSIGATRKRLILKEIVPSVLPPLLSFAIVLVSVLIVAEASLSFLGLGIHPPAATWGNMIAEARGGDNTMTQHPMILLIPGIALFMTVFSFNLVGERAQAKWDPRGAKL